MPDQKPPQDQHEEIDLTSDDEAALNRAWATITDADIAVSIRWLASLPRPRKHQKETPDHGH